MFLILEIRFRDPKRQIGTAYFDYIAKENDELSFKRGSLVEIIPKDWYFKFIKNNF